MRPNGDPDYRRLVAEFLLGLAIMVVRAIAQLLTALRYALVAVALYAAYCFVRS